MLDVAGHIRTRRGPGVARGPDVVHHCFKELLKCYREDLRVSSRASLVITHNFVILRVAYR